MNVVFVASNSVDFTMHTMFFKFCPFRPKSMPSTSWPQTRPRKQDPGSLRLKIKRKSKVL